MPRVLEMLKSQFPSVTSVVDARKPVRVEVTKRDVTQGRKKDHSECALAVACKRKFKCDGVIISVGRSYIIKGKKAIRFLTPPSVGREITSFDRGSEFDVGEYRLSAMTKSQTRRKQNKGGRKTSYSKLKIHRTGHIRASLTSNQD